MSFAPDELPWPEPGDNLFGEAKDWRMNACVNWGGRGIYSLGYRMAADTLVERVTTARQDQDALIHPIVFCYRQSLELLLKDLLTLARAYEDGAVSKSDQEALNKHRLLPLWRKVRPVLDQRWPESTATHDAAEETLRQFDQIDGQSFAFRYPTSKTGDPSLPPDMLRIDVSKVSEVVNKVVTFLEACGDGLDYELGEGVG